jgi:hypothetical protein
LLLLIVAAIVGWILIGSKVLGVTSFFASFLFLWYWAAVEQADYGQWTQSVVGALVGLLLAWQSAWLGVHYGQNGMIAGIVILLAAIYVQVMNWVPIAVNRSTMLYLTVLCGTSHPDGEGAGPGGSDRHRHCRRRGVFCWRGGACVPLRRAHGQALNSGAILLPHTVLRPRPEHRGIL